MFASTILRVLRLYYELHAMSCMSKAEADGDTLVSAGSSPWAGSAHARIGPPPRPIRGQAHPPPPFQIKHTPVLYMQACRTRTQTHPHAQDRPHSRTCADAYGDGLVGHGLDQRLLMGRHVLVAVDRDHGPAARKQARGGGVGARARAGRARGDRRSGGGKGVWARREDGGGVGVPIERAWDEDVLHGQGGHRRGS